MNITNEQKEIIKGFFESNVIKVSLDPLFQLTSGKTAPIYIDHRKIFSFPKLRKLVLNAWARGVKENILASMVSTNNSSSADSNPIVFAGTATAGIVPAYALAELFSCGFVYVRSQPKSHGLKSLVEGNLPLNANVIIVDDMVTTGKSVLEAYDNLIAEKVNILAVTSITRHDFKETNHKFTQKNVNLFSLFKSIDIFTIAHQMQLITHAEFVAVQEWLGLAV